MRTRLKQGQASVGNPYLEVRVACGPETRIGVGLACADSFREEEAPTSEQQARAEE